MTLATPIATASQTIGPYWHLLPYKGWNDLTRFGATGDVITITGRIVDGAGDPVTDACVELWQPSPAADAHFDGFGRCASDAEGRFSFTTLRPGPVAGVHGAAGNVQQAPHVAITIMARGLMKALATRIYFEGDAGHDIDPVLNLIEDPARRATLIAKATGPAAYHLDMVLQGDGETVFFAI